MFLLRTDMFPHLLHTKQFLDWRFGRQDGDDSESTAGASVAADVAGRAWPKSRRRPRRQLSVANTLTRRQQSPADRPVSRRRRRQSHNN